MELEKSPKKIFTLQGLPYMGKGNFTETVINNLPNPLTIEAGDLLGYDIYNIISDRVEDKDVQENFKNPPKTIKLKIKDSKGETSEIDLSKSLNEPIIDDDIKFLNTEYFNKLATDGTTKENITYAQVYFTNRHQPINKKTEEKNSGVYSGKDISSLTTFEKNNFRKVILEKIIQSVIEEFEDADADNTREGFTHLFLDGYPREKLQIEDFKNIIETQKNKLEKVGQGREIIFKHILINPIVCIYDNSPVTSIDCSFSLCNIFKCKNYNRIEEANTAEDRDYDLLDIYLRFILPRIAGRIITDRRKNDMDDFNLLRVIYPILGNFLSLKIFVDDKLKNPIPIYSTSPSDYKYNPEIYNIDEKDLVKKILPPLSDLSTTNNPVKPKEYKKGVLKSYDQFLIRQYHLCKMNHIKTYAKDILKKNIVIPTTEKDKKETEMNFFDYFQEKFRTIKSTERGGAVYLDNLLKENDKNEAVGVSNIEVHCINQGKPIDISHEIKESATFFTNESKKGGGSKKTKKLIKRRKNKKTNKKRRLYR